jgi:hypothetical protein
MPMSVHVDELHSEVVPAQGPAGRPGREPQVPGADEARWRELCDRVEWLAERVCAEGFGD